MVINAIQIAVEIAWFSLDEFVLQTLQLYHYYYHFIIISSWKYFPKGQFNFKAS